MLKNAFENGKVGYMTQPAGETKVSHLAYADDIIIFLKENSRSVKNLVKLLDKYQALFGQKINKPKSAIFFSSQTSYGRKQNLLIWVFLFPLAE